MASHIFEGVAALDAAYGALIQPVSLAQLHLRQWRSAYFPHLIVGYLTASRPSLLRHIFIVVGHSADKQMRRIHAPSIVTAVKDAFSAWNRPAVNLPRETVRFHATVKLPIAIGVNHAEPRPASGFVVEADLVPKSHLDRFGMTSASQSRCDLGFRRLGLLPTHSRHPDRASSDSSSSAVVGARARTPSAAN